MAEANNTKHGTCSGRQSKSKAKTKAKIKAENEAEIKRLDAELEEQLAKEKSACEAKLQKRRDELLKEKEEMHAAEMKAASALDVLIKDKTDDVNRISGWEELPPGGEYEYELDTTIYKTSDGDKWVMNDDKSFTKI